MEIIILLVIGWLLMEFCSFVYWWTKENDFTTGDIWFALFISLFGPVSLIVGWTVHGKPFIPYKIIIKKKGR